MNNFLKRAIGFLAFSLVIYLFLLFSFGLYSPRFLKKNLIVPRGSQGFMNTRLKDVDTTRNIDILFIGSSHSYRGYDPRIFQRNNLRVFNLGSSAQTPLQTEWLLHRYLKQLNPKLVVIDVYPYLFANDGVESSLDILSNGRIDASVNSMVLRVNNICTYNTYFYCLFRQIFNLDTGYKESPSKGLDTYVMGGYVEKKVYPRKKPLLQRSLSIELEGKQFDALARIVAELKTKGIDYVLVQAPLPKYTYNTYTNNDSFDSTIQVFGPYINSNKLLDLPNEMFLDDNHLNQDGVSRYNDTLIKLVKIQALASNKLSVNNR